MVLRAAQPSLSRSHAEAGARDGGFDWIRCVDGYEVPYTFLYQATTTDGFVAYLTNHATGAAYPAVTARTFQDAEILVPPEPLLRQFADITVPQAELIALLQRQNGTLRQTRDLLLPRLLSGQLSLADIEEEPLLAAESTAVLK